VTEQKHLLTGLNQGANRATDGSYFRVDCRAAGAEQYLRLFDVPP